MLMHPGRGLRQLASQPSQQSLQQKRASLFRSLPRQSTKFALCSTPASIPGNILAAEQAPSHDQHSESDDNANGTEQRHIAAAVVLSGSPDESKEEDSHSHSSGDDSAEEDTPLPQPPPPTPLTAAQKTQQFANRVFFGVVLGLSGAAAVLRGDILFLTMTTFITYQATQEYFGFITSKGIAKGMKPPPPVVSSLTTVLCVSIALISYYYRGKSGTILAVAAFLLLVMQVIANKRPKFSQLAGSVFGLFYCGWLPAFWVKLRMIPTMAPTIPLLEPLTGLVTWSVGLAATLTTVACIIAADTGAYFVGKNLGRTKLTDISPKKTVEGAMGGLASSVTVALLMWKLTHWPPTALAAAGLGVLTFFSSLFGDLIESIMKRDAGMKDSGDLIPGHGGLLDRFDSYMFTGATTYFYVFFVMPWCGF